MMPIPARESTWQNGKGARRLRRARRWQATGVTALAAYLLIATSAAMYLNGWSTHPYKEIFPFFSWSLFSKASNKKIEYSIIIHRIDDQVLDQPIDMRRADDLPTFTGSRSLSYKALQNVGKALASERPNAEADLDIFTKQYFGDHDIEFEVIKATFDPIERWHDSRSVLREDTLGRYQHRGRSS